MAEDPGKPRKPKVDIGEQSIDMSGVRLPQFAPQSPFLEMLAREGERLPLTELLAARNEMSKLINRRFKTQVALSFADIVGSTSYFQRFGDEAGQALMQRLLALSKQSLPIGSGRLVETTGDGYWAVFPTVVDAVRSLVALRKLLDQDNHDVPGDHRLAVRLGLHWGPVLMDGELVTGDAVNYCARVTTLADDGQIVATKQAFEELPANQRVPARALPPAELKGITGRVEALMLDWRDPYHFPRRVRILETGESVELPDREPLTFGRSTHEGDRENDVVLTHPDPQLLQKVSRRHFSLHRTPASWQLRALSDKATEVNGVNVARGGEAAVKAGTVIRVAGVLTLMFMADADAAKLDDPNKTVL